MFTVVYCKNRNLLWWLCDKIFLSQSQIIRYCGKYYPGLVTEKDETGAKVKTMEKCGFNTWRWPKENDEIDYESQNIMGVIHEMIFFQFFNI